MIMLQECVLFDLLFGVCKVYLSICDVVSEVKCIGDVYKVKNLFEKDFQLVVVVFQVGMKKIMEL